MTIINFDYSGYIDFGKKLESIGFKYLDSGCFRDVYHRDDVVIKVPHNYDGIVDNIIEHKAWHKYKNNPTNLGIYLAPCRLLKNNCLMMRHVDIYEYHHPKWAQEVDVNQVGLYDDKWMAYDFALDVLERAKWEKELGLHSEYFNSKDASRFHGRAPIRKKKAK